MRYNIIIKLENGGNKMEKHLLNKGLMVWEKKEGHIETTFAEEIIKERKRIGLTQQIMSRYFAIPLFTLQSWELKECAPEVWMQKILLDHIRALPMSVSNVMSRELDKVILKKYNEEYSTFLWAREGAFTINQECHDQSELINITEIDREEIMFGGIFNEELGVSQKYVDIIWHGARLKMWVKNIAINEDEDETDIEINDGELHIIFSKK